MTRIKFKTFLFTKGWHSRHTSNLFNSQHTNYVRMRDSNKINTLYREINYSSMNDEKNVYCNKP